MPSIVKKGALLSAAASVFLIISPAQAASDQDIIFVPGTGESVVDEAPVVAPLVDDHAASGDTQADMMAMADKLSDPRMQDGVANMVGNMTDAMLDLPVGKFAAAIERSIPGSMRDRSGRRIRERDTLGDLAGRDADRLPGQLADGSRQMMGMMSGFAAAFASMLPEFEKLGREMERNFDDIKDARRAKDYRRD